MKTIEELKNTIIHGDCLEVMKNIPDGSVDLVLTSPPYDNLRTYNGSLEWGEHVWKAVIQDLFRVIKDGGVVVWVVGDATIKGSETGTSFKQALWAKECGFNLHDTMIYRKSSPYPASKTKSNRYTSNFEYMFILSKAKPKYHNLIADRKNRWAGTSSFGTQTDRNKKGELVKRKNNVVIAEYGVRFNIWEYTTGFGNDKKTNYKHPATFPEALARDNIISWSKEGDTILDPFAGSGTTGVACKNLKRNYILIEKEPEYVEIIKKRLQ